MLKSMTGFGKATGTFQTKKVSVEIRSLNSKSIDLNARIVSQYREVEPAIRKLVANELSRGKVDVSVQIDSIGDESAIKLNAGLAKSYYEDLKSLNDAIGESTQDYLPLIMRMPDIFNTEREALSEEEKTWVLGLVKEATDKLNNFRRKEGLELESEYQDRIAEIRGFLADIPKYENERIETIRERMKKGLEDIQAKSGYDDNRFEQEMIFYIEKLDVSEEKMRLSNHLDYFIETMKTEVAGKKLGFISQEIGREINTLGSKSNHAQMQVLVIGMKDNLEKIKEQILNTL
jgi:uncharacterized protein (TIGR00255 family)